LSILPNSDRIGDIEELEVSGNWPRQNASSAGRDFFIGSVQNFSGLLSIVGLFVSKCLSTYFCSYRISEDAHDVAQLAPL
jgi:hypothetical protein